jgi:hypothetical protein
MSEIEPMADISMSRNGTRVSYQHLKGLCVGLSQMSSITGGRQDKPTEPRSQTLARGAIAIPESECVIHVL